jgi:hypothetical protein
MGKAKKKFEGGIGGWGTIYLDIRETISIDSNAHFRLVAPGFFGTFLSIFHSADSVVLEKMKTV